MAEFDPWLIPDTISEGYSARLPARTDPFDRFHGQTWDVHVQTERQHRLRPSDRFDDPGNEMGRRREIRILGMVRNREADRRNFVETGLDGRSHRPRIEHVDGRIRSVVDPRYDQRGIFFPLQQIVEGDLYAIHRRAVAHVDRESRFVRYFSKRQRPVHRDGMGHAALSSFRSHDQQTSRRA